MPDVVLPEDEFAEDFYLRTYPDVAAAVRAGQFASGLDHFVRCGRNEGRLGASTGRAAAWAGVAQTNEPNVAGRLFAAGHDWGNGDGRQPETDQSNPLRAFFDAHRAGPGIWKWQHYFDVYERHFRRFRGQEVHVLEIGVYSGGSLGMWRDYFGPGAHVYGVDIESACKAYEQDMVKVFIGDQADRGFWRRFRAEVPRLDIVIDDGGHLYHQQRTTLEELLPHLRPGGVFVCEDVHGEFHPFASYMSGMAQMLNGGDVTNHLDDSERRLVSKATPFQSAIGSVSFYPLVIVIEKNLSAVPELVAPKHGDQWQPFLL
jgi:SAM-dependent methyltransferase